MAMGTTIKNVGSCKLSRYSGFCVAFQVSRTTQHRRITMPKLLVLYYSSYGHIETMAGAIAEGAREVPNAEVTIKRVPELVPEEVARKSNFKLDQAAPIATADELPQYDAIIFGTPSRFGNMCAQMRNFLDQ